MPAEEGILPDAFTCQLSAIIPFVTDPVIELHALSCSVLRVPTRPVRCLGFRSFLPLPFSRTGNRVERDLHYALEVSSYPYSTVFFFQLLLLLRGAFCHQMVLLARISATGESKALFWRVLWCATRHHHHRSP
jgi:hypothetical protein